MKNAIARIDRYAHTYFAYLRRSEKVDYLPFFMGIETSGVCNLRCVMCPHGQPLRKPRGLMSFETFKNIIDDAKGFVLEADLFGGGEALLHPQICEMIRYAGSQQIKTRIHTNATKLTQDLSLGLLSSGLDLLSISFDGYDKASYEERRAKADFDVTLANITGFLKMKYQMGLNRPYTIIQSIVRASRVGGEAERSRAWLASLFSGMPVDELKVIAEHNYGGKVAAPKAEGGGYTPCTFPWYAIYVLWDGTIVPCCLDWWGDYALGNIASTSLREAWHSTELRELRRALASGKLDGISLCADCDKLQQKSHLGIPVRTVRALRSSLRTRGNR